MNRAQGSADGVPVGGNPWRRRMVGWTVVLLCPTAPGLLGYTQLGLGLATTLSPIALGVILGSTPRHLSLPRWLQKGLMWGLMFMGPAVGWIALGQYRLSKIDVILTFGFLTLGVFIGVLWGVSRVPLRKLSTSVLLTCALLEVSTRLLLGVGEIRDPVSQQGIDRILLLVEDLSDLDRRCRYLDSEMGWAPPRLGMSTPHPAQEEPLRILYLGDSMVEGAGHPGVQNFVEVLAERYPGMEHINAGLGGASPDLYLAYLSRLEPGEVPTHVLLFSTENDVEEVGRPLLCCQGRPLLEVHSGEVEAQRCEHIDWDAPVREYIARSGSPQILRATDDVSAFSRHLETALGQGLWRVGAVYPQEDGVRMLRSVYERLHQWGAERGIPMAVVVLPDRFELELVAAGASRLPRSAEIVEAIRQGGFTLRYPGEPFLEAVEGNVSQLWTDLSGPTDPHFGARGHAMMADWLADTLLNAWIAH